jgi:hypothetical protein
MAYRPYPCAERARRQLDRHTRPATVTGLDPLRGWSVTSADAVRHLSRRLGEAGELLRSAQPNGQRAMANIAAALDRMPSVARMFPAPVAPDPGGGT